VVDFLHKKEKKKQERSGRWLKGGNTLMEKISPTKGRGERETGPGKPMCIKTIVPIGGGGIFEEESREGEGKDLRTCPFLLREGKSLG